MLKHMTIVKAARFAIAFGALLALLIGFTRGEGMQHSGMAGMAMPPPEPEPKSRSAEPGQPGATLQPDDFDRPVPTSIEDAARADAINAEMAAGGHAMSHGTYKHIDAGRDGAAPQEGGHEHHHPPKARPSPSPDTRHQHRDQHQ